MPVEKNAECYNMNHKNRGKCVIFNHEIFEITNFDKREGTAMDAKRLEKSFSRLGFEVKINNDFTFKDIMKEIKNCKYSYCILYSFMACFILILRLFL